MLGSFKKWVSINKVAIIFLLVFFTMASIAFLTMDYYLDKKINKIHKEFPVVQYEDDFNSVITSIKRITGYGCKDCSLYCVLKDGSKRSIYAHESYDNPNHRMIGHVAKVGNRIMKVASSDTVYLLNGKNDTLIFLMH